MRKIIIISSYPNTPERESVLVDCIKAVSNKGYDIMVTSHYPISVDIQKMVNYSLYDSDNSHSSYEDSPLSWVGNEHLKFTTRINGHALAICRSMANSFAVAEIQKYDYFVFMEADNIISESDFNKLESLREDIVNQDKKMFFFKLNWYNEYNGDVAQYDTLIFGGKIDWFNKHMTLPLNQLEWKNWTVNKILERDFYSKLGQYESDFIIPSDIAANYFTDSVINKNTLVNVCEVAVDERNGNYVLFLVNFCNKDISYDINGNNLILRPNMWWWSTLNGDVNIITSDLESKEVLDRKFINFSELDKDKIRNKTSLVFH